MVFTNPYTADADPLNEWAIFPFEHVEKQTQRLAVRQGKTQPDPRVRCALHECQ